jgi:isopropylmalate/homocitrate/citramalate synthase
VTTFDSAAGGLGGCPYAPGAAGNLATEDLLYMLNGLGIETGVSIDAVASASRFIETKLDHRLPSRYLQAPPLSR